MIDFHNHILPNVDDGSKSLEMSLDMLKKASEQGITDVVNTVHFQHPKMSNKNVDYEYLLEKVDQLQSNIDKEKINIKIHLSSEVFYLPNLVEISNNPLVTIGNKKYMLVEFYPPLLPHEYKNEFFKLMLEGITPIIAHPERYRQVQNNIDIVKEWIDLGYIVQLDCGSIIGTFGQKTMLTAEKIIDINSCHLIGSDAHDDKHRNFCLKPALMKIEKKIGVESSNIIIENSAKILKGDKCELYSGNKKTFLSRFFNF